MNKPEQDDLTELIEKWKNSDLESIEAERLISLLIVDNGMLDTQTTTKQSLKVIANETIREIIEDAHMAGQADAGVDPVCSNARSYCNDLFDT